MSKVVDDADQREANLGEREKESHATQFAQPNLPTVRKERQRQ